MPDDARKVLVIGGDPAALAALAEATLAAQMIRAPESSSAASCRELIAAGHAALGRLDVLVNFATTSDFDFKRLYFLSQAAHEIMKKQGGGRIIHVALLKAPLDVSGRQYPVTTAGLRQLTRTMAVEWGRDNVQVNAILARPGLTGRVVDMIQLLASAKSGEMTGQTVAVDQGALAGGSWE